MAISDEHCLAIGKISVAFAELEAWVSFFVWQLIGPDQFVGQMVTAEMSFSRMLDLLSSLFQHRCKNTQEINDLKVLISRISSLEQKRNMVQHSLFIQQSTNPSEATRLKITAKRKKGLLHSQQVLEPKDFDVIARDLQAAKFDLSTLMITFLSKE